MSDEELPKADVEQAPEAQATNEQAASAAPTPHLIDPVANAAHQNAAVAGQAQAAPGQATVIPGPSDHARAARDFHEQHGPAGPNLGQALEADRLSREAGEKAGKEAESKKT